MDKTIISILAGLGGMFGWGFSDFLANLSSDKIGHYKTFFWSQTFGLLLVFLLVVFFKPSFNLDLLLLSFVFVSSIAYAMGYILFYRAFEVGNVSVVSSVINIQIIFVIAIAYFIFGQRLTLMQVPALIMILIGILLVSINFTDFIKGKVELVKGVKETLLSAVMFGIFYLPLHEYIVERADWLSIQFLTKIIALVAVFCITQVKDRI